MSMMLTRVHTKSLFLRMLFISQDIDMMLVNACTASADKQHNVDKDIKCTKEVKVSLYHLRSFPVERLSHTFAGGSESERNVQYKQTCRQSKSSYNPR